MEINSPIIDLTYHVWEFGGLIKNRNIKLYILIPVVLQNIFQFLDVYEAWGNIEVMIINAYFTILYMSAALRGIVLVVKQRKFYEFIDNIQYTYEEIMNISDPKIKLIVKPSVDQARFLVKFDLWLGIFISVLFCIYPTLTSGRSLPYGISIPFIDVYESPVYEIIYCLQILMTALGCNMYIPFGCFFISSASFGFIQIKVLQHRLRTCKEFDDNETTNKKLNDLVAVHNKIIDYVEKLNSLVTELCLLEFLTYGFMLIALLFLLNIVGEFMRALMVCAYIFLILSQVFIWYWFSNEIREESIAVGMALYEGPFLDFSIPMKRKIMMIIQRAQTRPMAIKIGNNYHMTLRMFQALINNSYTFFNLIRSVYK